MRKPGKFVTTGLLFALVAVAGLTAQSNPAGAVCPANHISEYNPDTYRFDCFELPEAADARRENLNAIQELRVKRLLKKQNNRSKESLFHQNLLLGEQQRRSRATRRR